MICCRALFPKSQRASILFYTATCINCILLGHSTYLLTICLGTLRNFFLSLSRVTQANFYPWIRLTIQMRLSQNFKGFINFWTCFQTSLRSFGLRYPHHRNLLIVLRKLFLYLLHLLLPNRPAFISWISHTTLLFSSLFQHPITPLPTSFTSWLNLANPPRIGSEDYQYLDRPWLTLFSHCCPFYLNSWRNLFIINLYASFVKLMSAKHS